MTESVPSQQALVIAIVSDTHVPDQAERLPARLVEQLRGVDLILHAGDLVSVEVLASLEAIARTVAVHGNMDEPAVKRRLPRKKLVNVAGRQIGLIHGKRPRSVESRYLKPGADYDAPEMERFYEYLVGEFPEADILVFGHFHVPTVRRWRGRLLVNPGPVAPRRGRASFALLRIEGSDAAVDLVDL